MYNNIINMLNVGLIILDEQMIVREWNPWMQRHSGIKSSAIEGNHLFEFYPTLDNARFNRNIKSVLTFNSMVYYSQKLHRYCFPMSPAAAFREQFDFMQQNCTFGSIESPEFGNCAFISIQDVTNIVFYESQLREMNTRDALTGTFNRRFLDSILDKEFKRHARYRRQMSVIMVDIDHFKQVNDQYGHQCGDEILKSFSSVIDDQLRDIDILARYGGEEFCCMLPETSVHGAHVVAERLRSAVEESSHIFQELELKVTASLGVCSSSPRHQGARELIELADQGLYRAKEQGRNTVVVSK